MRLRGRSLIGLLASLAIMGTPAAATAPTAPTNVTKNALPRAISQSKRATKAGVLSGEIPYMGFHVTGYDWIRARTNNFRRKGVGSKWQYTMFRGRR